MRNVTTQETVESTDPGRAMITGKWKDIGKFKGPVLRSCALCDDEGYLMSLQLPAHASHDQE